MRVVIQRVSRAAVHVDGRVAGSIGTGLLVLLGVANEDDQKAADYLVEKTISLRIFPDAEDKMNRSLTDVGGSLLVVSQFTLYGDVKRGRRPGFDRAAPPAKARELYEYFVEAARARGVPVETGVFQAMMQVESVNVGPVTILCDSEKLL
jgi:D-tyrosyl-tRNA(Tyr) deacylase